MQSKRRCGINGFTLLEILIVLGLLGVLTSLLLPVFARVREKGRQQVCQSNLKQIALGLQQYVQDNDGRYPAWRDWDEAIFRYTKSTQIFRCPTQRVANPSYPEENADDKYLYNFQRLTQAAPGHTRGRNESVFANASLIWMNMDADRSWLWSYGYSSCGRPAFYTSVHSGGANYSFVDGHVKWFTPRQMGELDCEIPTPASVFAP